MVGTTPESWHAWLGCGNCPQPGPVSKAGMGLEMLLGSLQASSPELVCRSCLKKTLHKLEAMMLVVQVEKATGTGTPTTIADSILSFTGVAGGRAGGERLLLQAPHSDL